METTDTTFLEGFIDQASSMVSRLRGGLLIWSRSGRDSAELRDAVNEVANLRETAMVAGLEGIAVVGGELESGLLRLIENRMSDPESDCLPVLDILVQLDAEITDLRFGLGDDDEDFALLLEESFSGIRLNDEPRPDSLEKTPETGGAAEEEGELFEIDQEMLEIFSMEAEDHLKNINEHLEILEKEPNHREALLEIRRSSHTLKGSAGIVGLSRLSDLAHKVEDLLDHISENEIEGNAEIFNLLLSATDCISAVANNDASAELDQKISTTFERFKVILGGSEEGEAEHGRTSQKGPEETVKEAAIVSSTGTQSAVTPAARSVVRVSLERLDELVRLVRELVFTRSVFQQRLSELELQIKELQNSTRRLQRSTGKLETDFGAGLIGAGTVGRKASSFPPPASPTDGDRSADSGSLDGEFDSLEFDRYTEFHQLTRELLETTSDAFSIGSEMNAIRSFLESLFDSQKRLIDEIQDKLLSLRMIRFGNLAARLQRTVKTAAVDLEKLVELKIEGEDIEVDTNILDILVDPLLHLLRNAVAHGIESPETRRLLGKEEKGRISLGVYSEGTHIIVRVTDDGSGISGAALKEKAMENGLLTAQEAEDMSDSEAYSLVFLPGVTTAEEISQVAGRGVGMNVVKTNILRQQGTIDVTSEFQQGTTFTIRLPMALAITRALLVRANERKFAFPLKLAKSIHEASRDEIEKASKERAIRVGDDSFAVSYLNELLGLPDNPGLLETDSQLVLLDTLKNRSAVLVDEIVKPEEIVIKPLGHPLRDVPELLGATILGDGTVVPVLDLVYLIESRKGMVKPVRMRAGSKPGRKPKIMIVDDSPSVRHVNTRLVRNHNWEPVVAKDGAEALEMLHSMARLPDVILTDVEMPEMDGYELLAIIKQNDELKDVPVVMITSRAGEKHRAKAKELGAAEFMTKPYEDTKLVEVIERSFKKR